VSPVIIDTNKQHGVNKMSKYDLYHNTYSEAVQASYEYARENGYEVSEDDIFDVVAVGTKKPTPDSTVRFSLPLYKNGKESKKHLHVQVYNRDTKTKPYELNVYVL
jgi:hypothetical protein